MTTLVVPAKIRNAHGIGHLHLEGAETILLGVDPHLSRLRLLHPSHSSWHMVLAYQHSTPRLTIGLILIWNSATSLRLAQVHNTPCRAMAMTSFMDPPTVPQVGPQVGPLATISTPYPDRHIMVTASISLTLNHCQ